MPGIRRHQGRQKVEVCQKAQTNSKKSTSTLVNVLTVTDATGTEIHKEEVAVHRLTASETVCRCGDWPSNSELKLSAVVRNGEQGM